ncbi:MAG: dihydropteroate synthase [Phycisphaerales bacterium]|nr:dihydropteroate synthase [Phycisphaerales bacterium]
MTRPPNVPAPDGWQIGPDRELSLDRPRLMGVLNVTPDSFSDGGMFFDAETALDRALSMIDEGADVIDVGGESSRPGARRVSPSEQIRRVTPVIRRIRARSSVLISVDTTSADVARAALDSGADIINDVSAATDDPAMLPLMATRSCGVVLMHRRVAPEQDSYSDRYAQEPAYDDVVASVREHLRRRMADVTAAGVGHRRIVLDPGLGFGKSVAQNYRLAARIMDMASLGRPVLSAASRKSFLGRVSGVDTPAARLEGTLAMSVAHCLMGVRLFRVHDVGAHRRALAVAEAIHAAGAATGS